MAIFRFFILWRREAKRTKDESNRNAKSYYSSNLELKMIPVMWGHSLVEVNTEWSLGELYYYIITKNKEAEKHNKEIEKYNKDLKAPKP